MNDYLLNRFKSLVSRWADSIYFNGCRYYPNNSSFELRVVFHDKLNRPYKAFLEAEMIYFNVDLLLEGLDIDSIDLEGFAIDSDSCPSSLILYRRISYAVARVLAYSAFGENLWLDKFTLFSKVRSVLNRLNGFPVPSDEELEQSEIDREYF